MGELLGEFRSHRAAVQFREEHEAAVWNRYRNHPDNRGLLLRGGVAGEDDLDAALESRFVVWEGDGTIDDPPVLLGDYVLHTLTAVVPY